MTTEPVPAAMPEFVPPQTFADRLNLLFAASAPESPPGSGVYVEYTNPQVAAEINRVFGDGTITGEYIRRLRKGESKSPSFSYVEYIAAAFERFFGFPVDLGLFKANLSNAATRTLAQAQKVAAAKKGQGVGFEQALAAMQRSAAPARHTVDESQEPPVARVLARSTRRLNPANVQRLAEMADRLQAAQDQLDVVQDLENDALSQAAEPGN
ncbi:hypothetical protein ABZV65_30350 [Streptomyces bauhiniae]|uniref:hypothetical protein n=1 Tax=Streptomyces bauhiniae TaxID=2340725 RepID=UPI0033A8D09E